MLDFVNKWKDKVAHYIDVRLQLMKLSVVERVSGVLSYFLYVFISLFLAVTVLVFLGIGIGEFLSEVLDSRAGGFFITTGIYIVLLIILLMSRKAIINKLAGAFIAMLTDSSDEADDEAERASAAPNGNMPK